ncbi:MAG TPA: helix-turn-helix transcriptional regulator [Chlorobaculum sp.]|nr:helix-turn-helix transcriptional regulator [Chlorobaculum sp.]
MADETLAGCSLEQLVRALKNAREQRSLTIDEIGRLVKIRSIHIEKLEEGDFSFLPPLYVFSYIRKYADELGVGNEAQLEQCRRELGIPGTHFSARPVAAAPAEGAGSSPETGGQGRKVQLIVGAAVILVIAIFLFRYL